MHILHPKLHIISEFDLALTAIEVKVLFQVARIVIEELLDCGSVHELHQVHLKLLLLVPLISRLLQLLFGLTPNRLF